MEWKGLKNGALLDKLHAKGIEGRLTGDENLVFQQSFQSLSPALIVLPATQLLILERLADRSAAAVLQAAPGQATVIDRNGSFSTGNHPRRPAGF